MTGHSGLDDALARCKVNKSIYQRLRTLHDRFGKDADDAVSDELLHLRVFGLLTRYAALEVCDAAVAHWFSAMLNTVERS